ncbi:MAG: hypothetical protein ACTIJ2_14275 [Sphingobacteriaceae bacterium]
MWNFKSIMPKLPVLGLAVLITLSLTACFDIVEEVELKDDGSGHISGTLNMSRSKTKVASLMTLDKIDGFKIPSEQDIRNEIEDLVSILRKTSGIRNVNHRVDFNQYVAKVSCDFDNIEALNAYTTALSKHFKINLNTYSNYGYHPSERTFSRSYTHSEDALKEFRKLSLDNRGSLAQAFYTSIYRFERPVQKQNNPIGKISSNAKAVMVRVPVIALVEGEIGLSNQIVLK